MYCLDHATGALVWFNPACEWIGSSPLILPQHGMLIVGLEYERPAAQGSMAAFRLSDGEKVWENYLKVYQHGSAAYWEPGDLAICGTNDHTIMALDAKTGAVAWVFPTLRSIKYAPRIDHERGLVIAASFDGNIYVLKAGTGEKLAAFKTDNICYTTPLVTHGRIFCGSGDRHLHVIDLDTMKLVKKIDYGARIYGSPRLIDERVIFGSNGGVMREIDPVSLETVGRLQLTDAITNAVSASGDGKRIYVPTYTNDIFCFDRV
jgi:outer membrane protein assembly factor BamB